jgi:hypothetical protein
LGAVEVLPLACQYSAEFVQSVACRRMALNRDVFSALLRDARATDRKPLGERLEKVTPLSGPLYGLALVRHAWNPSAGDVYLDRPNILTYRQHVRADDDGAIRAGEGFDIVENAVAVRAGADGDPFSLRLRQGVVDSNAEAILMAGAAGESVSRPPAIGAADVFAAARNGGAPAWVIVRNTQDPNWQRVRLPPDVRARVERDLQSGHTVLVPPEPVVVSGRPASAWWRIDPSTGDVLGMTSDGWGGALVEYTHLLLRIFLVVFSAYNCMESVKDSTVLVTADQKIAGIYGCLAIAVLAGAGIAVGALTSGLGLTLGGLIGTAGGVAGAAGTYYGKGGTF